MIQSAVSVRNHDSMCKQLRSHALLHLTFDRRDLKNRGYVNLENSIKALPLLPVCELGNVFLRIRFFSIAKIWRSEARDPRSDLELLYVYVL